MKAENQRRRKGETSFIWFAREIQKRFRKHVSGVEFMMYRRSDRVFTTCSMSSQALQKQGSLEKRTETFNYSRTAET